MIVCGDVGLHGVHSETEKGCEQFFFSSEWIYIIHDVHWMILNTDPKSH